jgi:hypothetical protein
MTAPDPRYDGKPFLKFLEFYVLWAIGELPAADAETMLAMTPQLEQTYGALGRWPDVIAKAMSFPPGMASAIRATWAKNTQIAARANTTLSPEAFARMFVDSNIPQAKD